MPYPQEFREAAAFIESVFEAEHQHGLACIKLLKEAYAQNPIKWDKVSVEQHLRSLYRKHLIVPSLQNTKLFPPFMIGKRKPERNEEARFQRRVAAYRKRFFYKISLYKSTPFGQVWRFLIPSVQNHFMTVDGRWDVVVHEDSMRLANVGQSVCYHCFGAATVTTIACSCEEPGYLFPPKNDVGVVGSPIAIFRSNTRPDDRYTTLFDGNC